MAAPQKYPTPHSQLLLLAVLARRRSLTFEEFWEEAVRPGRPPVTVATTDPPPGAVRWPRDTADRHIYIGATVGAREAWRRAYDGAAPTRQEDAVRRLAPWLDRVDELAAEVEGALVAA